MDGQSPGRATVNGPDDPFAVLCVEPGADDAAVRAAYRDAVRAHPPTRDPEGFKAVRQAYERLQNPASRVQTLLLRRYLVPRLDEALVGTSPHPPSLDEMLEDLRAIALEGTDLARTTFPGDLRPIGG